MEVGVRKRAAFIGAAATVVGFLAFPVLAVTTSLFDGVADGVGVFWIVALVEMVVANLAAAVWSRWLGRAGD